MKTKNASYQTVSLASVLHLSDLPRFRAFIATGAAIAILVLTIFPTPAYAFDFVEDVVANISTALLAPLIAALSTSIDSSFDALMSRTLIGDIVGGKAWTDILSGVYLFIERSYGVVIVPIAMQLLTLVFMFRLLGLARMAESDATQPLVAKLITTIIGYFLMGFVVQNAMAIVTLGYNLMQQVLGGLSDPSNPLLAIFTNWTITEDALEGHVGSLGTALTILICFALVAVFAMIANLVALGAFYSKVLKLYIYAFFAPIPLALFGLDSTRQWALGFLKNLASVFLAIILMYFILEVFPLLVTAVITNSMPDAATSSNFAMDYIVSSVNPWTAVTEILVLMILLILFLVKSSSIAREILGN